MCTLPRRLILPTVVLLGLAVSGTGCGSGNGGGGTEESDGFTNKSGSLASGDDVLTSEEYTDDFTLSAEQGQWIEVVLTSSDVDPYLILKPPSCPETGTCEQQLDNDDLQSGDTRAFIFANVTESGTWTILATSSTPGESGSYDLSYRTVDAGTPPATAGIQNASRGLDASGTLAAGDKTLDSGEFVDNYAVYGEAGQNITIDLRSSVFDPYLILVHPDKAQDDNDDFAGAEDHSRIEATLPVSGVYRISVTSYEPGETGAYTLSMSAGGAGSVPAPEGDAVPFEK